MPDLLTRLQQALGAGYRVEKELGGGGMSRVFLAEEVRLGRRVVVKVLPPEMAAGVSVDRFEREIQLAAKLQHPHIVPLLTAGSSDDLLYYIMPFIEGESLRAKLAREGELPVPEALQILRDVLDALAYAHRHHVVHRDMKPDNVLLSEGHALVTDFGVAKAVAESTGKHTLTSMGVALGTPAYMAPEQATADPHTDHRADIYAVGAMAYEMLSGRPPFMATNAQAMLAAHVTEAPEPVTKHRGTVPPALNELILRCLEKKPADRWQRADELIPHVAALLTPTGGTTPTGTRPVISSGTAAAIERAHPVRVAALFGLASVGVLAIVYALVQLIGLPDWVFYGAIALLAVGLPVMLLTGHHERRRALARSSGRMTATLPGGLQQHFTWRKALLGGGVAFAGLGVVTAGYMTMRLLGIGPVGTLVAAGSFEEGGTVVLADLVDRTERGLGVTFTEAFRIDLSQSSVLRLMPAGEVRNALQRMEREPTSGLTVEVAREVAVREGAAAVLTGEINAAGGRYLLAVQFIAPETGDLIAAFRETAADSSDIIEAIDRLSRATRARVGESLRSVRAGPGLARATTGSLPALRKYTEAWRAITQGDLLPAIRLLQEAVALDTTFAEAYRTLGIQLNNGEFAPSLIVDAFTRAYRHRHRLREGSRLLVEGSYFSSVAGDPERSNEAYRAILDLNPRNVTPMNNIGVNYRRMRRPELAAQWFARAAEINPDFPLFWSNLVEERTRLGDRAGAETAVQRLREIAPKHPFTAEVSFALKLLKGERQSARAELETYRREVGGDPSRDATAANWLAALAGVEGRRRDRAALLAAVASWSLRGGGGSSAQTREVIRSTLRRATYDVAIGYLVNHAVGAVDDTLTRQRVDQLHPLDRPYAELAAFYARAGRPERAEALLGQLERGEKQNLADSVAFGHRDRRIERARAEGWIALRRGRAADAVAAFRRADVGSCWVCALPGLAMAYDAAGESDSALAVLERYVTDPQAARVFTDETELPGALRRLGELWEQKGNRDKAIEYYDKFVELWKNADPELQPVVNEVKQRMAKLVGEQR